MHDAEERPRLYLELDAPQYDRAPQEKKPEPSRVLIIDMAGDDEETNEHSTVTIIEL